jgi:hypothetical protein
LPRNPALAALATLALLPAAAHAVVYEYGVARFLNYTQTSAAAPAGPEYWSLYAYTYVDVNGEIVSASVSYDMPPQTRTLSEATPTLHQFLSAYYTTAADFYQDYPGTTYSFAVDLGAGPEYATVSVPEDLFPPQVPQFSGDTWDRLQSYNTALAFTGSINGFALAPGTDQGSSNVTVVKEEGPVYTAVFSVNLDPGDTSFEIPAALLEPATFYSIGVSYVNSATSPDAGFSGATALADYIRGTGAYFTTLAPTCGSADFNCDGDIGTDQDIEAFFACLAGNCPGAPCPSTADFNADGDIGTDADIEAFFRVLAGGPC